MMAWQSRVPDTKASSTKGSLITVQHKARTLFRPRKAQEIWHMTAGSERAICHAQLVQLNRKVSDTVKTLFIQLIAP